jgi:hypothetical protein
MKELEKSREEKVETYQKLSSKGEEDAILLFFDAIPIKED